MRANVILLFLSAAVLGIVFQNCSQVSLENAESSIPPFLASGKVEICLDGVLQNYTLENFLVANLNRVSHKGALFLDSDADGVPDVVEIANGSNPFDRYSAGPILDSICLAQKGSTNCRDLTLNCNQENFDSLGLGDCDLEALGLNKMAHPTLGLDSDRDGYLDFIEILRGTLPNVHDSNSDPDRDLVLNGEELRTGTNPLFAESSVRPRDKIKSAAKKTANSSCAGETWLVTFEGVEIVPALGFSDPKDSLRSSTNLKLSRNPDENIVFMNLVLSPKLGSSGNTKVYSYSKKIKFESSSPGVQLDILFTEFVKNGEVRSSF